MERYPGSTARSNAQVAATGWAETTRLKARRILAILREVTIYALLSYATPSNPCKQEK
jgi:hypothetical protein